MNGNSRSGAAAGRAARTMRRFTAAALLLLPLLAVSPRAEAVNVQSLFNELCQYSILDSDTCAAKAVLECLVNSGGSMGGMQQCAANHDPEAQRFIDIYGAATQPDHVRLLELAGPVIACKLLPPGPPANILCGAALKPIVTKAFGKAARIYDAASKGDWLTVIYVVGDPTIACAVVPAFPGKDITCGAVGQLLVEGEKLLKQGGQAGIDALESGATALGSLASAGLGSLGLGGAGVAPETTFYANHARPLLHRRALKALMSSGKPPFLGFDDAMLQQCASAVHMGLGVPPDEGDFSKCQFLSKRLHDEASALAALVRVAPAAYFENISATASLLQTTNFWSGKAEQFVTGMGTLARPKWSEAGFGSLPSPFSAVLVSCYANSKEAFPVPLGPAANSLENVVYPPNLWGWVCGSAGNRLAAAMVVEKARLTKQVIPQLASAGCLLAKTGDSSLKFDCNNGKALVMCHALLPDANPNTRCRKSAAFQSPTVATVPLSHQPMARAQPPVERAPAAVTPPSVRIASGATARPTLLNIEAEASVDAGQVSVTGGRAGTQPMQPFGSGWSGDSQLFWTGGSVGAALELGVEVPVAGEYAMEVYVTRAPDYADVEVSVNGQPMGYPLSLYSPQVMPPVPAQAGSFALSAGLNTIRFEISGKYQASSGYFMGIDRLRFYPTGR